MDCSHLSMVHIESFFGEDLELIEYGYSVHDSVVLIPTFLGKIDIQDFFTLFYQ